jgi:TolB protein
MLSEDPRSPFITALAALALLTGLGIVGLISCGGEPTAPGWTRDSLAGTGEILFLSNREGGENQLFVINSAGTEALPAVAGQVAVRDARWSHDGARIAYTVEVVYDSSGYGEDIYLMDRTGTTPWPLVTSLGPDRQPRWNPDDTQLAFLSERTTPGPGLYVVNVDGSEERRLVSGDFPDQWGSWSPDGASIVISPDTSGVMQIVNVTTGSRTSLVEGYGPAYSPGGDWIAYHKQGIHLIKPDKSDQRTLTGYGDDFRWSPQGQYISFRDTNPYTPYTLEIIGVDGESSLTLVQYQESWRYVRYHSWSADEKYIAFSAALNLDNTESAIFVATLGDSTARVEQVTFYPVRNENPEWRPQS